MESGGVAMVNRWTGIFCAVFALSVNAALVWRDLLPQWLAGDPPQAAPFLLREGRTQRVQMGIFDQAGRRVGYSWTLFRPMGRVLRVQTWTVLTNLRVGPRRLPRLEVATELTYQEDRLDMLALRVDGLGVPVLLEGVFVPPDDFPCEWQVGHQRGQFVLPAALTRALGDALRPFDRLPGLFVGQSWRLEVVNPLTHVLGGSEVGRVQRRSVVVRVVAEETVWHRGQQVRAYRVEAPHVRAWVAPDGRIVRQEVEVPLLGPLVFVDEPYDEQVRRAVTGQIVWGPRP